MRRHRTGIWPRACAAMLLLAPLLAAAAQPPRHALGPSASRVLDYVDDSGTTHLTNVPEEAASRTFDVLVEGEPAVLAGHDPGPSTSASREIQSLINEASVQHHVEPALLYAVMATESAFNSHAVSPKGAVGLMQLMPETAARLGVADRLDARSSVFAGARYLRSLLDEFDGDVSLAVAGYNAGGEAVERYHRSIPPYSETQAYVPRVLGLYQRSRAIFAAP